MISTISDDEFEQIQEIIYNKTGVFLRSTKKFLVIARLWKRIQALQLKNFSEYISIIQDPQNPEVEIFINAITTNETFFFRHTKQFNYLFELILPSLKERHMTQIQVASGACSTGEEPYSIAIALMEFCRKNPGMDFKICAFDINTQVIKKARQGQYDTRSLKNVPGSLLKKYFREVEDPSGGKETNTKWFEVSLLVKQKVEFFQHNLKNPLSKQGFDIFFLRNVMIYFDRPFKQRIIQNLEPCLKPGGYFIVSLAEHLTDITSSLKLLQAGVYQKVL